MQAPDPVRLLEEGDIDRLAFGVIGFDEGGIVRVYNQFESVAAGLLPERVLGFHLFDTIAPCMNNYLVAQRFEDAAAQGEPLDATIDYVLTLRMRPTAVKLRLLAGPPLRYRYVLVQRAPR
nr:phosphonate transporter [Pseudorhodoferax sp. Leaf267]